MLVDCYIGYISKVLELLTEDLLVLQKVVTLDLMGYIMDLMDSAMDQEFHSAQKIGLHSNQVVENWVYFKICIPFTEVFKVEVFCQEN